MNHETLQALYALDVAEVGEDEAAKRWDWWYEIEELWITLLGPVKLRDDQQYRRKPDLPWPKVMMQDTKHEGPTYGQLNVRLENALKTIEMQRNDLFELRGKQGGTQEWPADAPEWAKQIISSYSDGTGNRVMQFEVINRPKPVKQKIDWSKLRPSVERYLTLDLTGNFVWPSNGWIAWNCDEHTRGNPLPDGLVVEWYYGENDYEPRYLSKPDWDEVTRFRIVGIQEGWA